jgi:hypothetical protein
MHVNLCMHVHVRREDAERGRRLVATERDRGPRHMAVLQDRDRDRDRKGDRERRVARESKIDRGREMDRESTYVKPAEPRPTKRVESRRGQVGGTEESAEESILPPSLPLTPSSTRGRDRDVDRDREGSKEGVGDDMFQALSAQPACQSGEAERAQVELRERREQQQQLRSSASFPLSFPDRERDMDRERDRERGGDRDRDRDMQRQHGVAPLSAVANVAERKQDIRYPQDTGGGAGGSGAGSDDSSSPPSKGTYTHDTHQRQGQGQGQDDSARRRVSELTERVERLASLLLEAEDAKCALSAELDTAHRKLAVAEAEIDAVRFAAAAAAAAAAAGGGEEELDSSVPASAAPSASALAELETLRRELYAHRQRELTWRDEVTALRDRLTRSEARASDACQVSAALEEENSRLRLGCNAAVRAEVDVRLETQQPRAEDRDRAAGSPPVEEIRVEREKSRGHSEAKELEDRYQRDLLEAREEQAGLAAALDAAQRDMRVARERALAASAESERLQQRLAALGERDAAAAQDGAGSGAGGATTVSQLRAQCSAMETSLALALADKDQLLQKLLHQQQHRADDAQHNDVFFSAADAGVFRPGMLLCLCCYAYAATLMLLCLCCYACVMVHRSRASCLLLSGRALFRHLRGETHRRCRRAGQAGGRCETGGAGRRATYPGAGEGAQQGRGRYVWVVFVVVCDVLLYL